MIDIPATILTQGNYFNMTKTALRPFPLIPGYPQKLWTVLLITAKASGYVTDMYSFFIAAQRCCASRRQALRIV
jgi:hypothetical protein